MRELQRVRLYALAGAPAPVVDDSGPPRFDLSDGVSSDEAVAVAVFLNPALRAFRRERGVAEGDVVAAGALTNPELEVTWLHIENLTKSLATSGFDVGLRWSPPRPGEIGARRAWPKCAPRLLTRNGNWRPRRARRMPPALDVLRATERVLDFAPQIITARRWCCATTGQWRSQESASQEARNVSNRDLSRADDKEPRRGGGLSAIDGSRIPVSRRDHPRCGHDS